MTDLERAIRGLLVMSADAAFARLPPAGLNFEDHGRPPYLPDCHASAVSSFLVSKIHIDALLSAALHWADRPEGFLYYRVSPKHLPGGGSRLRYVNRQNVDQVGAMLWRENFLAAAWDEDPDTMPPYMFEQLAGDPEPIVVLGAIACYRYQTEGEAEAETAETEAFWFMYYLESAATQRLRGMDRVPWGIEDPNVFLTWRAGAADE